MQRICNREIELGFAQLEIGMDCSFIITERDTDENASLSSQKKENNQAGWLFKVRLEHYRISKIVENILDLDTALQYNYSVNI